VIWRALAVWFGILVLANLNGAARQVLLIPRLGDTAGRVVSTLILSGGVVVLTWLTIPWIGPGSTGDAIRIGVLWLGLTLAFEFLVGHYVFGNPWSVLLADYDVSRGRIWIVVLVLTLLAPLWTARLTGVLKWPQ
jgi:hypothetical protein